MKASLFLSTAILTCVEGWVSTSVLGPSSSYKPDSRLSMSVEASKIGGIHGENSCFLPLEQCDEEWFAPRIVQIAGMYPGVTKEEVTAVSSSPPAEMGQWSYDFSDPEGPQMGTVAFTGSEIVSNCEDPVAIICEHFSLGVPLPDVLKEPVDLLVLVDRAKKGFAERKFHVVNVPGEGVLIKAFSTRAEIPDGAEILGRVDYVQVPWLPCMKKKKSGFMEDDAVY